MSPIFDPLSGRGVDVEDDLVRERWNAALQGLGLLLLGGAVVFDYMTRSELSVGFFYLLPVFLVTWSKGRHAGLATAALASLMCLLGHVLGLDVFSRFWVAC